MTTINTERSARLRAVCRENDDTGEAYVVPNPDRYALVERRRGSGSLYITTHESQEAATRYQLDQPNADEWEPVMLYDLDTGIRSVPEVARSIIWITPAPDLEYEAACASATRAQGLGEVVVALASALVPVVVDQTGGFTMCVGVYSTTVPGRYLWVTLDSEPERYLVGRYENSDDQEGVELAANATTSEVITLARQFLAFA